MKKRRARADLRPKSKGRPKKYKMQEDPKALSLGKEEEEEKKACGHGPESWSSGEECLPSTARHEWLCDGERELKNR